MDRPYLRNPPLRPLLKWTGGKDKEIKFLRRQHPECFPERIARYYEPFVGGGACFFNVSAPECLLNDLSGELISFYRMIQRRDEGFFAEIDRLTGMWMHARDVVREDNLAAWYDEGELKEVVEFLSVRLEGQEYHDLVAGTVRSKLDRMKVIDAAKGVTSHCGRRADIEGAVKAAIYTHVRRRYNERTLAEPQQAAHFYFVRDYCYSGMFRYGIHGNFNVPYGGASYNTRRPDFRTPYWRSPELADHLGTATFACGDFEAFLAEHPPAAGDFLFVDPPYDSTFNAYAGNPFGPDDQARLAEVLARCPAQWLLVVKDTELISGLYKDKGYHVVGFDKSYTVNFRNRNERAARHIAVTNF